MMMAVLGGLGGLGAVASQGRNERKPKMLLLMKIVESSIGCKRSFSARRRSKSRGNFYDPVTKVKVTEGHTQRVRVRSGICHSGNHVRFGEGKWKAKHPEIIHWPSRWRPNYRQHSVQMGESPKTTPISLLPTFWFGLKFKKIRFLLIWSKIQERVKLGLPQLSCWTEESLVQRWKQWLDCTVSVGNPCGERNGFEGRAFNRFLLLWRSVVRFLTSKGGHFMWLFWCFVLQIPLVYWMPLLHAGNKKQRTVRWWNRVFILDSCDENWSR